MVEAERHRADFATYNEGTRVMKTILKSAMLWRFLGGFALGAVGVLTLHPATAQTAHAPATIAAAR
ncbi:MAG: hypothetical protein JWO16_1030 [Sphingomonas bacterium]|jgi:hypothetical protein|nr:hypothetical protein [Sphingomonas bacterium]